MSKQSTNFVVTLNNYTPEELLLFQGDPPHPLIKWICFEEEHVQEGEGTPHLQGAVVLKKKTTITGIKKIPLFKRAHVEVMEGTLSQNEIYCNKEKKMQCFGIKPMTQQEKGDAGVARYDDARAAAKRQDFDAIPSDIYIRNRGSIHAIANDATDEPLPRNNLENYWIQGPSGCGKSSALAEKYGSRAYLKKCDNKWFDHYDPAVHDVIIIEDICAKQAYQMTNLKIWSDHRAFIAEKKNGSIMIRPNIVIVTSNHTIDEVFADPKEATEEDIVALKRRFAIKDMFDTTTNKVKTIWPSSPKKGILRRQELLDSFKEERPTKRQKPDPILCPIFLIDTMPSAIQEKLKKKTVIDNPIYSGIPELEPNSK